MNIARVIVFTVAVVATAAPAFGQRYERILLPLAIDTANRNEIPGAYGSRWTTRLTILNASGRASMIYGYDQICRQVCPMVPTPPNVSLTIEPLASARDIRGNHLNIHGYLMAVESEVADQIHFTLRAIDLSRQSGTWGTNIPVVRERELLRATTNLLDIRNGSDFRSLLRIYDVDERQDARVLVRVFATGETWDPFSEEVPDRLVGERVVQLQTARAERTFEFPGYAEVPLWLLPEIRDFPLLRVEITPLTTGLRYWAFVSVTHNETQHVTIITPQ